jgi:hypothetical protein
MPDHTVPTQPVGEPVFQALDGTELKRIILAEVQRSLDNDAHFKRHLTYPLVSFAFSVVISAYPMEPPEFQVQGRAKYQRASVPADVEPEVIAVKGELNIDAPAEGGLAPDEARERANIATTEPTRVPVGKGAVSVVDQQVAPTGGTTQEKIEDAAALASGSPSPSQLKRLADQRNPARNNQPPRNRAGASPNFARSVNLTTRAEPGNDGTARVDENIMGNK